MKEIYRWYLEEGLSLCSINKRLNELSIPSPSGKSWNRTAVHYILTNPAYTGRTYLFTRYKTEGNHHLKPWRKNKLTHTVMRPREEWVAVEGTTPAIITEELFEQVQMKLKRNKELALRNARREYLLSGYIFCGNCGKHFTARKKTQHSYYSCPKCKDRSLNVSKIETSVWQEIEEAVSNPEVVLVGVEELQKEQARGNVYREELERIEGVLRHLTKEKDRVWKAFELTGDEPKFTLEVTSIMSRIEEAERQKLELQERIESVSRNDIDIKAIQQYHEEVSQNIGSLSFNDKRKTLEALRVRVIVGEEIRLKGTLGIVSSQYA